MTGTLRLYGILLALVAGSLGVARVLDLTTSEQFVEWLARSAAAIAIMGGISLCVNLLGGPTARSPQTRP